MELLHVHSELNVCRAAGALHEVKCDSFRAPPSPEQVPDAASVEDVPTDQQSARLRSQVAAADDASVRVVELVG